MLNTNIVIIAGKLTRDPESRSLQNGRKVCDFSIAVKKPFKPTDGSPDCDFFRVNCWDRTAEWVAGHLTKGHFAQVEGRLQSRKYVASDGSNREVVEILATNVQGYGPMAAQPEAE